MKREASCDKGGISQTDGWFWLISPYPLPLTPSVIPGVDLIKNALLWCLDFFLKISHWRRNP